MVIRPLWRHCREWNGWSWKEKTNAYGYDPEIKTFDLLPNLYECCDHGQSCFFVYRQIIDKDNKIIALTQKMRMLSEGDWYAKHDTEQEFTRRFTPYLYFTIE